MSINGITERQQVSTGEMFETLVPPSWELLFPAGLYRDWSFTTGATRSYVALNNICIVLISVFTLVASCVARIAWTITGRGIFENSFARACALEYFLSPQAPASPPAGNLIYICFTRLSRATVHYHFSEVSSWSTWQKKFVNTRASMI